MIVLRSTAAATALAIALLAAGCGPNKPEPVAPTTDTMPSADRVAAAKARYAAKGDYLVGSVDTVNEKYAAVTGIDPKAVKKDDAFHFIDVEANDEVCMGLLHEVGPAGSLIIEYDKSGSRAPRPGDLCVKIK
jgi:hypothetical protein